MPLLEQKTFSKKMIILNIIIIFFIGADRLLKTYALKYHFFKPLIGDYFNLSFYQNSHIAFSLPLTGIILEIFIGLVIIFLMAWVIKGVKLRKYFLATCLVAVILGASSNLLDRLVYDSVIDYLDVKYFTVFNLADVLITAGVLGVISVIIKEDKSR